MEHFISLSYDLIREVMPVVGKKGKDYTSWFSIFLWKPGIEKLNKLNPSSFIQASELRISYLLALAN